MNPALSQEFHLFCEQKQLQKHATLDKNPYCVYGTLNMKWRHLGHLNLLSRAVAVMVEMEISSQEEMANPQRMKVFAIERHELPEDFVYFPALCGVQSSPLVFVMNRLIVWGPLQVVGTGRVLCASSFRSPDDLSAQVRRVDSCTSCKPAHTDASITCTDRNG